MREIPNMQRDTHSIVPLLYVYSFLLSCTMHKKASLPHQVPRKELQRRLSGVYGLFFLKKILLSFFNLIFTNVEDLRD